MSNPRGISLHVGVNEVDGGHYRGWTGALAACEADAEAMRGIAEAQGFESRLLLTREATRAAVTDGIRDAVSTLQGGDIFFLSYAGHGGQVADRSGDEDDGADETWCLYDGQLIDDELSALWSRFAPGVRILLLSDSCHSGTVSRAIRAAGGLDAMTAGDRDLGLAGDDVRFRFMPDSVARPVYWANKETYDAAQRAATAEQAEISATVRLLSGCQDDQLSRERGGHGLFTHALLEVWDGGAFDGDYRAFHQAIVALMPPVQRPNHKVDGAPSSAFDSDRPFAI